MLLRFGCENFKSFQDYQELSLIASALKDPGPDLFSKAGGRIKVLPLAIIYGANASGKTNALHALRTFAGLVESSHRSFGPDDRIERKPFALDKESAHRPTRFDCDFLVEETRFHYGYEFDEQAFTEEWLYAFEGGHRRTWFYRTGQNFSFGKYLRGQNRVIADITRPNSLFLSAAIQNNHEYLRPIYEFFTNMRFSMGPNSSILTRQFERRKELKGRVIEFLAAADTGIEDARIDYDEPDVDTQQFAADLGGVLKKHFPEMADDFKTTVEKQPRLALGHGGETENPVYLPMTDESRGTLRALELALDVFSVLESGGLLVVDELEASLHTLLSRKFLSLFASEQTNPKHAQMVCTTHDTNLLCAEFLRRDQIWFTEKDKLGHTHLYPLTAIRTRNTDNLEKGYLQGRFGAVPFFGTISKLFDAVAA